MSNSNGVNINYQKQDIIINSNLFASNFSGIKDCSVELFDDILDTIPLYPTRRKNENHSKHRLSTSRNKIENSMYFPSSTIDKPIHLPSIGNKQKSPINNRGSIKKSQSPKNSIKLLKINSSSKKCYNINNSKVFSISPRQSVTKKPYLKNDSCMRKRVSKSMDDKDKILRKGGLYDFDKNKGQSYLANYNRNMHAKNNVKNRYDYFEEKDYGYENNNLYENKRNSQIDNIDL